MVVEEWCELWKLERDYREASADPGKSGAFSFSLAICHTHASRHRGSAALQAMILGQARVCEILSVPAELHLYQPDPHSPLYRPWITHTHTQTPSPDTRTCGLSLSLSTVRCDP